MNDPRTVIARMTWTIRAVGLVGVGACAWFAFAPPPEVAEPSWRPPQSAKPVATMQAVALPPEVFATARLLPERDPALGAQAAAQTPALAELTLVGIVREDGTIRAALFLARENRLALVKPGDTLGTAVIRAIDDRGLELEIDHAISRLDLVVAAPFGGGS